METTLAPGDPERATKLSLMKNMFGEGYGRVIGSLGSIDGRRGIYLYSGLPVEISGFMSALLGRTCTIG